MSLRINHYVTPENDRMNRFHIPFTHFQTYARDMERHLFEKHIQAFEDKEENLELEDKDDQRIESTWKHFLGDVHMYTIQFPNILRSSLLISLFSFLENQLIRLCKELQQKLKLAVKFNSISGKGIEKAKVYLAEVVNINFPSKSKEWQKIKDYQNIRNSFAHSEGIVKNEDKNLMGSIERLEGVEVRGESMFFEKSIILFNEFILEMIETIKSFWGKIEEQYLELLYPAFYIYKNKI